MTTQNEGEGYIGKDELDRQRYLNSMDVAGHIQVVLDRAVTGEGGDWAVYTSYDAILGTLGHIISKDALTYSEANEFNSAREKLKELEKVERYDSQAAPKDQISFGFLLGVSRLFEKIVEIKSESLAN